MAMLKTMTKEAGEPKGSPAGKAAPADKAPAGKTSPEAIRAGLHLQPKEAGQLDKIVLAGKRVMFDSRSHKMFLEQLDGPGDIAQKLGQGVAGLMALLVLPNLAGIAAWTLFAAATHSRGHGTCGRGRRLSAQGRHEGERQGRCRRH